MVASKCRLEMLKVIYKFVMNSLYGMCEETGTYSLSWVLRNKMRLLLLQRQPTCKKDEEMELFYNGGYVGWLPISVGFLPYVL